MIKGSTDSAVDFRDAQYDVGEEEGGTSDSSSEEESDEEDLDGEGSKAGLASVPMTAEEHASIKTELDAFISGAASLDPAEAADGEHEEDGEDEEEHIPEIDFDPSTAHALLAAFDDEEGPTNAGPIVSQNEEALPPVPLPALTRLPDGEKLSLAGDVVSWMRDRRVEVWVAQTEAVDSMKAVVPTEDMPTIPVPIKEPSGNSEVTDPDVAITLRPNDRTVEEGEVSPETVPSALQSSKDDTAPISHPAARNVPTPKFNSAGTVVIRAMQSRPGSADDGWLEEGSVICWEDGSVLGAVSPHCA